MHLFSTVMSCFLFISVIAQKKNNQIFKIIEIPAQVINDHPGIKTDLNKQLSKVTSKQEAFAILNKQLKTYKNSAVRLREQMEENKYRYLVYFISAPKEDRLSIVDIKGTRDFIDENIFKKYQLRILFTDTLAIIDTLKIAIYPSDFKFKINDYFIVTDNNGPGKRIQLPSQKKNLLMLCQEDFYDLQSQPLKCLLYNTNEPDREIAEFYIHFINQKDCEELYSVAETLIEENKGDEQFAEVQLVTHIKEYAKTRWGSMQSNNISNWLKKAFKK